MKPPRAWAQDGPSRLFVVVLSMAEPKRASWNLIPAGSPEQAAQRARRMHPDAQVVDTLTLDAMQRMVERWRATPTQEAEIRCRQAEGTSRTDYLMLLAHRVQRGLGPFDSPLIPMSRRRILQMAPTCDEETVRLLDDILRYDIYVSHGGDLSGLAEGEWRRGVDEALPRVQETANVVGEALRACGRAPEMDPGSNRTRTLSPNIRRPKQVGRPTRTRDR